MKKRKQYYRTSLLTVSAFALLALSACSHTPAPQPEDITSLDTRINNALERAAAQAAKSGQTQDSLALLEKMYKRNSHDPETAVKYAKELRKAGHLNRASLILSPFARDKETPDIASKIEFSSIQSALGNYSTAEEFARQALELDPTAVKAHHVLGVALDAQGAHEEAETEFRAALDEWNDDPSMVMNNLGLNLAAQSRFEEAIEILQKAADIAPYRREIERNLRIVTALNGDPDIESVPAPARKPGS